MTNLLWKVLHKAKISVKLRGGGGTYPKFSVFAVIKLWLDLRNPNLVSFLKLVIVDPCDTAFEKKLFFVVFGLNSHFRQKQVH